MRVAGHPRVLISFTPYLLLKAWCSFAFDEQVCLRPRLGKARQSLPEARGPDTQGFEECQTWVAGVHRTLVSLSPRQFHAQGERAVLALYAALGLMRLSGVWAWRRQPEPGTLRTL